MKVIVQDNQIEKAIRDLKKKLTKEGFFSEIKERKKKASASPVSKDTAMKASASLRVIEVFKDAPGCSYDNQPQRPFQGSAARLGLVRS